VTVSILIGDVRDRLRSLPDESVHCVVTSPPYWGLRSYLQADHTDKHLEIGCEPTLGEHLRVMVELFDEVRRVLRRDGVCWVNYGDCYATSPNGRTAAATKAAGNDDRTFRDKPFSTVGPIYDPAGGTLKPKDLCMVPQRFAIEMQNAGWWVRAQLPWLKRNCMPESISDRPAVSIEWVFMFTKSARYQYDASAVMLPISHGSKLRVSQDVAAQVGSARANGGAKTNGNMKAVVRKKVDKQGEHESRRYVGFNERWDAKEQGRVKDNENFESALNGPLPDERNFRNADLFWLSLIEPLGLVSSEDGDPLALDVPPQGFTGAHFATFPPKLIKPLILAGCPVGGTVLDPFLGAGTTAMVADRLGRDCIGIELNGESAEIAERRIKGDAGMFAQVAAK
jgi:DNA modification methylase